MKEAVITIDGPAGAGKSTVSKAVAAELNYLYLDTGALYRALAYTAMKNKIDLHNPLAIASFCRPVEVELKNNNGKMEVFVDGEGLGEKIRSEEAGLAASVISAYPAVREKLLALQRQAGAKGGIVAEGRDMGTVVFPDARFKFFLDAGIEERIKRRAGELSHKNREVDTKAIARDMEARDKQDADRQIAPLAAAKDALVIDSTLLSIAQVVEIILRRVRAAKQ
ncbi:MAG TPA: (d)CMP kinase [Smithellaceae bacterium]|nr:(d)CMP kinase [Smithellaceae bacterium]HQF83581.1 (d)CMP kinase [Smithellaceae bacterium]HQG79565.1 (d)CMP kinase [Smithellaceae bacterium]